MNVIELVPGDIILLVGGVKVPADVRYRKGDKMKVDTAALTGEPIPRTYPGEHGDDILAGCTICEGEAYCQVLLTGENTEIGKASKDVYADKTTKVISLFEEKIMKVVYSVIVVSCCFVLIAFLVQVRVCESLRVDLALTPHFVPRSPRFVRRRAPSATSSAQRTTRRPS